MTNQIFPPVEIPPDTASGDWVITTTDTTNAPYTLLPNGTITAVPNINTNVQPQPQQVKKLVVSSEKVFFANEDDILALIQIKEKVMISMVGDNGDTHGLFGFNNRFEMKYIEFIEFLKEYRPDVYKKYELLLND